MNFKKYIKAVATGPKGNKDLTLDESCSAIEDILINNASKSQIGAFLIGLRTKYESIDELQGAIKALRKYIKFNTINNSVELGYSFDGRCNNPFLFPLYEKILNDFYKENTDIEKLILCISGDHLQPAKNGITTKEIFSRLDETHFLYFNDRTKYLNELSKLTNLRQELGLRTIFNTVEKLLNPNQSEYGIITAFHKPYVQKYLEVFSPYFKKVIVVKASEGSPEVFNDGKFWIKNGHEIIENVFSLEYYGIKYDKKFDNITLEQSLHITNNPSNSIIKLAKFNIALILFFCNRVLSIDEACQRLNINA